MASDDAKTEPLGPPVNLRYRDGPDDCVSPDQAPALPSLTTSKARVTITCAYRSPSKGLPTMRIPRTSPSTRPPCWPSTSSPM